MRAGEEGARSSLVRRRKRADSCGEEEALKAIEELAQRAAKPRKHYGKSNEGS